MTLKEKLRYGMIAGVVLVVLLFVVFNFQTVQVNVILGTIDMPKAIVILGSFGAGVGVTWLWNVLKKKKDPSIYS